MATQLKNVSYDINNIVYVCVWGQSKNAEFLYIVEVKLL